MTPDLPDLLLTTISFISSSCKYLQTQHWRLMVKKDARTKGRKKQRSKARRSRDVTNNQVVIQATAKDACGMLSTRLMLKSS